MRKISHVLILTLAVILLLSSAPTHALYDTEFFTDVPGDAWYCEAAYYVNDWGFMQGTEHFLFSPELTTTRGMIVTILHRIAGEPPASGSAFADVAPGEWYARAIAWANVKGIVNGYPDGRFGPNDPITREQMAAILYRYAAFRACDISGRANLARYRDAGAVSAYAREAMAWANAAGLITGVTADTLAPTGSATRAQCATIFMRFNEQFLNPPRPDDPNAKWFLMSEDTETGGAHSITIYSHTQEGHVTTARTPAEGKLVEIHRNFNTKAPSVVAEQTFVNGKLMTTVDYDKDGNVLTEYDNTTDEQTVYTYNNQGVPTRAVFYSPKSGFQSGIVYWLRYAHTPGGQVQSITRWDNVSDTYVQVGDRLVVSDADARFHSGEYHYYDAAGNLTRITAANAAGRPTNEGWEYRFQNDAKGRVVRETYTDSTGVTVTTYEYDAWDHVIQKTVTADGVTTTTTYHYRAFVF